MLRNPSFHGHRRYSITHRAVQRLRELVPSMEELDDEALRDKLDVTLGEAEDSNKAVRTLDAMLGEPQVLIPVDSFGELLYAIIKEDTVVTVLPQAHGQEILQRGQALEEKVAGGEHSSPERSSQPAAPAEPGADRWEPPRRRWRRDGAAAPVVIERAGGRTGRPAPIDRSEPASTTRIESEVAATGQEQSVAVDIPPETSALEELTAPERPEDEIAGVLFDALARGRRRAMVKTVRQAVSAQDRDSSLVSIWNQLAEEQVAQTLTVGDLIDALAPLR